MSSAKKTLTLERKRKYLLLILALIVLDQAAKLAIAATIKEGSPPRPVIRGFFDLIRVHNPGAVWGMFSDRGSGPLPKIITGLSILALLVVAYYFLKTEARHRLELLSFSLILGGALGNLVDRIRLGYVVDFIDWHIKNRHWPTFNVADSCISIGVVLLAWAIWREKCTPS